MLGQLPLNKSRSVDYLGITLKDSISWKEHVELWRGQTITFIHQIKRNTSNVLSFTAVNFCKSTYLAFLTKGSNFYMPSKSDKQPLEKSPAEILNWILLNLSYCEQLLFLNLLPYNYCITLLQTDLLLQSN